jgi:ribosomal protein S15P/S13E
MGKSLLVGALMLAPVAAAGQRGATTAASPQEVASVQRLDSLTRRVRDLTGHFEQMRDAVESSPELQNQRGWAGPRSLGWTVELGGLVGAMTEQARALARHLEEARSAESVSDLPDIQIRLNRLHHDLTEVAQALEGMVAELETMRAAVHGQQQSH